MFKLIVGLGKGIGRLLSKGWKKAFGKTGKTGSSISKRGAGRGAKNLGSKSKIAQGVAAGTSRMAKFSAKYPKMSKALRWTWRGAWVALDAYFIYSLFSGDDEIDEDTFDEATDFAVDELMGTPLSQEALSIIYSSGRLSDIRLAVAHYVNKTEVDDLDDHGLGIIECALDYKSKAFDDYLYSPTQSAAVLSFLSLLPTGTIPGAAEIEEVILLVQDSVLQSRFAEDITSIETDYITHYYLTLFTGDGTYDEVLTQLSDTASAAAAIEAYLAQDTALVKSAVSTATDLDEESVTPGILTGGTGSFEGLKF